MIDDATMHSVVPNDNLKSDAAAFSLDGNDSKGLIKSDGSQLAGVPGA